MLLLLGLLLRLLLRLLHSVPTLSVDWKRLFHYCSFHFIVQFKIWFTLPLLVSQCNFKFYTLTMKLCAMQIAIIRDNAREKKMNHVKFSAILWDTFLMLAAKQSSATHFVFWSWKSHFKSMVFSTHLSVKMVESTCLTSFCIQIESNSNVWPILRSNWATEFYSNLRSVRYIQVYHNDYHRPVRIQKSWYVFILCRHSYWRPFLGTRVCLQISFDAFSYVVCKLHFDKNGLSDEKSVKLDY